MTKYPVKDDSTTAKANSVYNSLIQDQNPAAACPCFVIKGVAKSGFTKVTEANTEVEKMRTLESSSETAPNSPATSPQKSPCYTATSPKKRTKRSEGVFLNFSVTTVLVTIGHHVFKKATKCAETC